MNDDAERPEAIEETGTSEAAGTEASEPVGVSSAAPARTEEPPEESRGGPTPPDSTPAARAPAPPSPARPRPALSESQEPLYREAGGFRLRLEPADLARLRELPGAKGRTDQELGEEFFEKQAERFVQSLAEDVTPPAEVRVVVDPYSRQVFLAIERTIRSILSF
ncbi:MAG TPA: hypothetical protein VMR54_15925 [Thermoanaerobaculia bacterium]|nr:hypothetical protein [Thermoanaerobaculia bacterium]